MGRLTPPQLLILSFLCAIIAGTILLALPVATHGPGSLSLVDSLFTATSATCVTGLVVRDTGTQFTSFGRWVIFALFQAGGLGIMTFSTLFAVLLGRRIGFYERDVIKGTLDKHNILGLNKLITYILCITAGIELIAAGALFLRWRMIMDWSVLEAVQQSIFHAVSGFCNAGFSLFRNSLMGFEGDPYINLIMIAVIFFGGIGFVVIMDLLGMIFKKGPARRMSLQSKVALIFSGGLILFGAILLFFFERNGVFAGMTIKEGALGALFQSVTARTAGFNTVPIGQMTIPALLLLIFLMFIGASPGSTGGGIKTCTFAVLMATTAGMLTNKKRVRLFDRSVPRQVIREALVIFFLSLSWIFVCTLIITYVTRGTSLGELSLVRGMFEVVSAFGTVGLSTGITEQLNDPAKICIIVTMFAGRVGPLTMALAVAFRERKDNYVFPEEAIMVG